MVIFDFLAALFTAVLSGTGIGGGGLYILYLTLVKEIPQLTAQGINLAFFIMGALSSLLLHFRKRKLLFSLAVLVGILGALGALFGSYLAHALDMELLSKCFGGMLVFVGARTLLAKVKK